MLILQTTRTHNISLFVTVLSACLGLLAVGAPLPLYAQSAARTAAAPAAPTTPGARCDEEAFANLEPLLHLDAFNSPVSEFIADLGRLVSIGKYQLGEYEHVDFSFEIPKDGGPVRVNSSSSGNRWLRAAAHDAAEKFVAVFEADAIFYSYDEQSESDIARLEVAFHLDRSGLGLQLTQELKSFAQAQKLAANYNASFNHAACRAKDEFERSFFENTRALVKEHKIVIITNLPRAALENPPAEQPPAAT